MCRGLARAHSGYSPRRAIMGNRHIPVQQLPTPYLFSRKEKQKKNVRVLDRHGEVAAEGSAIAMSQGGGDSGSLGRVS